MTSPSASGTASPDGLDDGTVALRDHITLLTGFPFKSEFYTEQPDGVRLVRGDNVVQGQLRWDKVKRWPLNRIDEAKGYELREGDVILAMDRPWIEAGLKYARIGPDDVPSLLVQRVACLRAKDGLDQGYLFYLIGSHRFTDHVLSIQTGTAVPHISGPQMLQFRYRPLPLDSQRAIAAVLGALDDKIEQNRRTARALERLARAIFRAWFVDFEPVKAKAAGAKSFPSMPQEVFDALPTGFVESEIGAVPEGWGVKPLGALIRLEKGLSYKGRFLSNGCQPMINLGCFLGDGRFDSSKLKGYCGDHKPKHLVEPGELVLANTDVTQSRTILGSPAIVRDWTGDSKYLFTHHVFAARPLDESARHWIPFIYHSLLAPMFRERFEGFATGTTVLGLPRDAVETCKVAFPSALIRDAFVAIDGPLDQHRVCLGDESAKLAKLRDYLLPKLLSGEVRVREAERAMEEAV